LIHAVREMVRLLAAIEDLEQLREKVRMAEEARVLH
jgi:hypothetical protein